MKPRITIDPEVDMHTTEFVQVIIEFKTPPTHTLMTTFQNISIEKASERVRKSYEDFKNELPIILGEKGYSYTILHRYTAGLNGIAMELQGIAIQQLLSSHVIQGIYVNREVRIPEKPLM